MIELVSVIDRIIKDYSLRFKVLFVICCMEICITRPDLLTQSMLNSRLRGLGLKPGWSLCCVLGQIAQEHKTLHYSI